MANETDLIDRLRKIEALFSRPGTAGERDAAANALERIRGRVEALRKVERPVEYKFTLGDIWSRKLFLSLLARYRLESYRYRGQRRTTVMVRVTKSFVDGTLWPEFEALDKVLCEHLDRVTTRIIDQAFGSADDEAEVREPAKQLPRATG